MFHDSQIACPYTPGGFGSVVLAKPFEPSFHQIDRTACPILDATDAESQQAAPQPRGGFLIPPGAVSPPDISNLRNRNQDG